MNDSEPIVISLSRHNRSRGGGGKAGDADIVSFTRHELNLILKLYGLHVAAGEWHDYAIDMLADRAVFSIFRNAAGFPHYRIEKIPALARRQGAWRIVTASGQILKRGHDLEKLLRVLAPKPRLAASRP
jgi:hypothetical protein